MIRSITLLGSSSGRNAGDAALIAGIMDSIDDTLGRKIRYEIPTINPRYILEHYDNDTKPISMMPWSGSVKMLGLPTWRSIKRTDLTLIFDAILFDRSLYNPLFNFMSTLFLLLPIARKRGKKMAFFNVGAGPVNSPRGKKMLKSLSEIMDFITVRDGASFDILSSLKIANPRILTTADAAINLRASSQEKIEKIYNKIGLNPDQEILAVNVNRYLDTWADDGNRKTIGREAFVDIYAKALDFVLEKIKCPVLFINTQYHDIEIAEEIRSKMASTHGKYIINNRDYNHYDIKGVMQATSLLFGMRLHANILASSALTPIIGLNYQPKVDHYFSSLGLKSYSMSFDEFSVEGVSAHILRGWEDRKKISEVLKEKIPEFQAKAHSASQFVLALDKGGDLDETFHRLKSKA